MANGYEPGSTSTALALTLSRAAENIENMDSEGAQRSRGVKSRQIPPLVEGLIPLPKGDNTYDVVKEIFLRGMGAVRGETSDVSISRISYSGFTKGAKTDAFRIFETAMANKNGGNANVKYCWYGAPRGRAAEIVEHGFDGQMIEHNGMFGCGIYLYPDNCFIERVKSLVVDIYGSRHLVMCRAILGKQEVVYPGSNQCHPRSEEFDSGVDKWPFPEKYIVWGSNANTHILPEYVVSFRAPPCLKEFFKSPGPPPVKIPISQWTAFTNAVVAELGKYLPPASISLIAKYHRDFEGNTISRKQLLMHLKEIAGEKLLISIVKSFHAKHPQNLHRAIKGTRP